jgi:hypothetical protein
MRHPEPKILIEYKTKVYPEICHTCEYYDSDGLCLKFRMEPPEDFAATHQACPEWFVLVPF